jgi:hypothetical protein
MVIEQLVRPFPGTTKQIPCCLAKTTPENKVSCERINSMTRASAKHRHDAILANSKSDRALDVIRLCHASTHRSLLRSLRAESCPLDPLSRSPPRLLTHNRDNRRLQRPALPFESLHLSWKVTLKTFGVLYSLW